MSHRKTKLIQERNILLERKYILEQAPPPPPPPPAGGTPPPPPPAAPTTGGTTSTIGGTEEKKFTKEQINGAPNCSGFKGIDNNSKYEKKEQKIDGKTYVYYLSEKKDGILCQSKDEKK